MATFRILSDCNCIRTQNHLVCEWTLNHLVKLALLVYELSGSGFESSCSHLNFRFRACFEQGVSWHSGNYRAETRTWHDKNVQSVSFTLSDIFRQEHVYLRTGIYYICINFTTDSLAFQKSHLNSARLISDIKLSWSYCTLNRAVISGDSNNNLLGVIRYLPNSNKRLIIWENLSHLTGKGYLDVIPFYPFVPILPENIRKT